MYLAKHCSSSQVYAAFNTDCASRHYSCPCRSWNLPRCILDWVSALAAPRHHGTSKHKQSSLHRIQHCSCWISKVSQAELSTIWAYNAIFLLQVNMFGAPLDATCSGYDVTGNSCMSVVFDCRRYSSLTLTKPLCAYIIRCSVNSSCT